MSTRVFDMRSLLASDARIIDAFLGKCNPRWRQPPMFYSKQTHRCSGGNLIQQITRYPQELCIGRYPQ